MTQDVYKVLDDIRAKSDKTYSDIVAQIHDMTILQSFADALQSKPVEVAVQEVFHIRVEVQK